MRILWSEEKWWWIWSPGVDALWAGIDLGRIRLVAVVERWGVLAHGSGSDGSADGDLSLVTPLLYPRDRREKIKRAVAVVDRSPVQSHKCGKYADPRALCVAMRRRKLYCTALKGNLDSIVLCRKASSTRTGQNRTAAQIVITITVVSSSHAPSRSMVSRMLFVFRSSPNPSLASESALCPPNPSPSSITTWTQRLIRSSVALNLPSYRSLRPSVATITLFVTDWSSLRCWTSGTEDT